MANIVFENTPKVPLSEFLDILAYEFTDASYGLLENCLKRTITRIAERSNIMRRTVFLTTQCGVHNYLLEPPDCMEVIAIMSICYWKSMYMQGPLYRLTSPNCTRGCCFCFGNTVYVDKGEIVFSAPQSGTTFRIELSVKPTKDSCDLDKILLDDHEELVLDGVRSLLFAMVDKPWSSMQRAQASEQAFLRGCAEAAVDTMLGNQRGVMKAKHTRIF